MSKEKGSILAGLFTTWNHLFSVLQRKRKDKSEYPLSPQVVTVQYPKEKVVLPLNARNKLHNEIDDCIVCDLCARICPVNCIEIESVKSVEDLGLTSDGSKKRLHALRFDIDMDKCMFCGLCTTVCPTECLTMTADFDYSVTDKDDLTFSFAKMNQSEALQKLTDWEKQNIKK